MFGAEHPVTVFNQPSGQDGRTLWFSGLPHRFKVGEPHLQRAWVLWFVGLLALSQSLLEYRERALGVIGLALNRTGFVEAGGSTRFRAAHGPAPPKGTRRGRGRTSDVMGRAVPDRYNATVRFCAQADRPS